jgi:hypothetical protein
VKPARFGEDGFFCLPERGAGCGDKRPFVQELADAAGIEGNNIAVCGHAFTSCAGLAGFRRSSDGCEFAEHIPPSGDGDAACGLSGTEDNTRCRSFPPGARCTFRCSSIDDCPCGHDCTGSSGNQVCSFTYDAAHECL